MNRIQHYLNCELQVFRTDRKDSTIIKTMIYLMNKI